MAVDFELKRVGAFKAIVARWSGPWNEKRIQREFEKLDAWAKSRKLRTGRWVFTEPGERKWLVGLEVSGSAGRRSGAHTRSFPAARVAQVVFDPEVVEPRVIYHGVSDWLRWQKKEKKIRAVGMYREIYQGNPWRDKKAWAKTTIQVVVRP